MARNDFVCQYANCEDTDTPIVVSDKRAMSRDRFCCASHAAFHLLRNCSLSTLDKLVEEHKS